MNTKTLPHELLLQLLKLNIHIGKHLAGPLSGHGISLTEYLVLRALQQAPESRQRRIDLAREVGLSASGITRLLKPMEKIGLVRHEATARDARVSLVVLTPAGASILADADATFEDHADSLLGATDPAQLQQLFGGVSALLP